MRSVCAKGMHQKRSRARLKRLSWHVGGQGRNRTGDLSLFRRTLLPTELPGLCR